MQWYYSYLDKLPAYRKSWEALKSSFEPQPKIDLFVDCKGNCFWKPKSKKREFVVFINLKKRKASIKFKDKKGKYYYHDNLSIYRLVDYFEAEDIMEIVEILGRRVETYYQLFKIAGYVKEDEINIYNYLRLIMTLVNLFSESGRALKLSGGYSGRPKVYKVIMKDSLIK